MALNQWVEVNLQFLNLEDGWSAFLDYLSDRNGADIQGLDRRTLPDELADGLENDSVETMGKLSKFEDRTDVQDAFRNFARERKLPLPEGWPYP